MTSSSPAMPFDAFAIGTDIQRRIGVKTERDAPLGRFTTMRVGGPADLFVVAHNVFELRSLVRFARSRGIPWTLLGRGSDLVISDAGIRGLVIHVRAEGSKVEGERYIAQAGVPMARAATETQKAGLTGLEFGLADPGHGRRRGVGECRRPRRRRGGDPGVGDRPPGGRLGGDARRPGPRARLSRQPVQARNGRADPGGHVPADRRRSRDDQGTPRRHPPLAPGAPAAGAAVGRIGVPQPAPGVGGSPDRRGGAQGHAHRRCRRLAEARELHRQRPQGDGTDVRRLGEHVRATIRERHALDLRFEIVFLGDWTGWRDRGIVDVERDA